jgi:Icc-related predicted phosphoesterase
MRIEDLKILPRDKFESTLNELGDAAAENIKRILTEAVSQYEQIYLVTHVPPFREAALDRSRRICDDAKIPFYACRASGEAILEIMNAHPDSYLTILCGHTHERCEVEITSNIKVKVLDAGYGTWYQPETFKF